MILLLGGSGYVGTAMCQLLEAKQLEYRNVRRSQSDYTNVATLTTLLRSARPSFLINCAGYTGKPNVDACELHKAECLMGNAVLPGVIREACEQTGVPWGHVSSGCIYAGDKSSVSGLQSSPSGFTEDDPPNFSFRQNHCSFYSGTKALGEEVLDGASNCYVWRLRIPFDNVDNPRNYLTKVMRYDWLLEARNSLSQLHEFVRAAFECWERRVPFGIYNVTNPGSVTTREVVDLIEASGVVRKEFKFFANEADFMHRAAKAPRSNCVLDTTKLQRTGIQMTEVHKAIERALKDWKRSG